MPTRKKSKVITARNSCARTLKSSSEERVEMRACETRKSASYRSVDAVSAALWTLPLIPVRLRDFDNISHLCQLWVTETTLVTIAGAVNKIYPDQRRRHSAIQSRTPSCWISS